MRDLSLPYPLPVDLPELHRQSLRSLLLMRVYGAPFCNSTFDEENAPRKVLEIGCGTALWSSACSDFFKSLGHDKISFTGLDIAPLAPDLNTQGVDWRFVQHDLRKQSMPFPDQEFDFIFIKDSGFCVSSSIAKTSPLKETMRMLKPGGIVELWESDHVIRTLLPNPTQPKGLSENEIEQAEASGAYIITSNTSFVPTQNKYLADYNTWVESALGKRGLTAAPCGMASWALGFHSDTLKDAGSRRIALPFTDTRWEREAGRPPLTSYQISLRRTALETSIGFIESMEPVLKEVSGKRQDEWDRWRALVAQDLLENRGALNGECFESGAWWATKC